MSNNTEIRTKEFEEKVVSRDRVSRVVKGGRRMRSRILIVIGDKKGRVGFGIGKSDDVSLATAKAVHAAKKNMITVPIKNDTIPHEVTAKHTGAIVMLKPAGKGTSVIAGGAVRSVIEMAGISNILSKSLGSSNAINVVAATFEALKQLKTTSVKKEVSND
ncbi:MAG: 30S ribosomal protein S5 [Patescibacteria group bacterium]|jgi:small subunit ribosomal protein S5